MRNTYKKLFDDIKPSETLMESVFEMHDKKKKSFVPKLISAMLAFTVFATATGFGIQYHNQQEILKNPIGNIMLANASEAIGQSSTKISYRLFTRDITGMTEQEIYDAKFEMLDKQLHLDIEDEFTLNDGMKNTIKQNGNVIYATERGGVNSSLILRNIDNPDEVEKIIATNSNALSELHAVVEDARYTNPEENIYVSINEYDTAATYPHGNKITIDGKRYAACRKMEKIGNIFCSERNYKKGNDESRQIQSKENFNRFFYISYLYTDEFYNELGKNPSMLSEYYDEITTRVYFKYGYIATTVLSVNIDENGYLTLKCKSYDYSK